MRHNDHRIFKINQNSSSHAIASRSRWFVGSSRSKISGLPNSACARSTFTFCGPVIIFHHFIMKICLDSKTIQKRRRVWFSFPSVHRSKFTFKFTCLYSVFIREIFFCINRFFSFIISYSRAFPMITVSRTGYSSYLKWSCCKKERRSPGVIATSPFVGSSWPDKIFKT